MEYTGKLYGKIGNKYFDTGRTSEEFDKFQKMAIELQLLKDAQAEANGAERGSDECHIQNVSNMLPEELCKLHGHAMYSVYSINNTANGNSIFFGLNKCSRCGYEEPWQYDF